MLISLHNYTNLSNDGPSSDFVVGRGVLLDFCNGVRANPIVPSKWFERAAKIAGILHSQLRSWEGDEVRNGNGRLCGQLGPPILELVLATATCSSAAFKAPRCHHDDVSAVTLRPPAWAVAIEARRRWPDDLQTVITVSNQTQWVLFFFNGDVACFRHRIFPLLS